MDSVDSALNGSGKQGHSCISWTLYSPVFLLALINVIDKFIMLISVLPIVPLKCSDTKFDRIFTSELISCKKTYFE